MFGISLPELIVIFVVVLVFVGPEKLPEIARAFGKITGELKKHSDSLRREFYNSVYTPADELKRSVRDELLRTETKPSPNRADNPSTDASSTISSDSPEKGEKQ